MIYARPLLTGSGGSTHSPEAVFLQQTIGIILYVNKNTPRFDTIESFSLVFPDVQPLSLWRLCIKWLVM